MSKFGEVTLNKTQGEERWIPCSVCDGETLHKVLVSANIHENDKYEGIQSWEEYEVVQCQGCRTISFRQNWQSTEEFTWDEVAHDMDLDDHPQIFPPRVAGRHKLRGSARLNYFIRAIYDETHSALCNHMPVLAGAGIRALVEVVCKDKGAKGSNLEQRIDDLVTIGVLGRDGAEILHSLRIMGNQSLHEITPQSEEDLNTALDVAEHLLEGVYILPAQASALPKRK